MPASENCQSGISTEIKVGETYGKGIEAIMTLHSQRRAVSQP